MANEYKAQLHEEISPPPPAAAEDYGLATLIGRIDSCDSKDIPKELDAVRETLALINSLEKVDEVEELLLNKLILDSDEVRDMANRARQIINARIKQPPTAGDKPKPTPPTTAVYKEDILDIIKSSGWSVRLNEITHRVDVGGFAAAEGLTAHGAINQLPIVLRDMIRQAGMKITKEYTVDSLSWCADKCRYNPVTDMLNDVKWDGDDRITTLYEILGVTNEFYQTLVKKWLIQCVAMALNDEDNPYGAEGVLVLSGGQGIGKTRFFGRIALEDVVRCFYAEGKHIDVDVKDSLIEATGHWIVELGELDSTLKKEQSSLKAFITAAEDEIRRPYATVAEIMPRRTSFCATVNGDGFLCDDTGNRRWWVIPIERVDVDRLFSLSAGWRKQMWAQIYSIFLGDKQGFRLTAAERDLLNGSNAAYERALPGEGEVRDIIDDLKSHGARCVLRWMTVADFKSRHDALKGYSVNQIGKVLDRLGYAQTRKKDSRTRELPTLLPENDGHGAEWYHNHWNDDKNVDSDNG